MSNDLLLIFFRQPERVVIGWAFLPTTKPQGFVVGWVFNPPQRRKALIDKMTKVLFLPFGQMVG